MERLKGREARTDANADNVDLRGRTYAIPFATVWDEAVALAGGGLRGWRMVSQDEDSGSIVAHVDGGVVPLASRVEISIRLDDNAQTRVDASARSGSAGFHLGVNTRRIRRLLRFLDRALAAEPHQILDARIAAAHAGSTRL